MKKLIALFLTAFIIMLPTVAFAYQIQEPSVTIHKIDYISSLADIVSYVDKDYSANERFALLIDVDLPWFVDSDDMTVSIDNRNCTIDSDIVEFRNDRYIVRGTVVGPNATVKVDLKYNDSSWVSTPTNLYQHYIDRNYIFTDMIYLARTENEYLPTIPKTGDNDGANCVAGVMFMVGSAILVLRRRIV